MLHWYGAVNGSPDCSCDGLEEHSITVRKRYRIDIRGLMIWDVVRQYVEVFEASVRLAGDAQGLDDYVLKFGRRGGESRRIPYSANRASLGRKLDQRRSWNWAYVFRKGDFQT